jgi:hypothetical protein
MRFNLSIYGDETLKAKFDYVKEAQKAKNPGLPLSDSAVGAVIVDEAYQKILGAQTNSARITTIIESLALVATSVESTGIEQGERLSALEIAVRELADIIRSNQ